MIPTEKLDFITKAIKSQKKHDNYGRVTELAKEYHAHISGWELDSYLRQFVMRETEEMFAQRKRLTNAISPALANSLIKPFYKVSRNGNIRKSYDLKNPNAEKIVRQMMKTFYGSREEDNKGLDYWLKMRFIELEFNDPNSFVVIEWEGKEASEILEPRPFEVTSFEAWNFEYKYDELQWLFCRFDWKYIKMSGNKEVETAGDKFTLYDKDFSINIEQFDPKYHDKTIFVPKLNQVKIEIDKKHYLVTYFEPNIGYVPAFRVGYLRDSVTNGKTYVNPFHSAMTFFRKSLKVVSELDLTMTLHAFPQKWQYAEKCKGESKNRRCDGGIIAGTKDTCKECKGTGVKTHTSAQDIIYLPIPDDPKDSFDLDKMSAYKYPPIDLIKFQNDFIIQLKEESHLAVYNSNMFLASDPQFAKTATEIDDNSESIYDAIEPYTEKFSEVWKFIVKTMVRLTGITPTEEMDISHTFPSDLKLKTTSILLSELEKANTSNAPSFMRDAITNQIAGQIYLGDDLGMLKYYVRHRFFPFNGKTSDEISLLISSQYVSDFTKILYANYEAIFTDIEKEYPNFYLMEYLKQWEIVEKATQVYIDELKSAQTPQISFGTQNPTDNVDNETKGEETDEKTDEEDETKKETE